MKEKRVNTISIAIAGLLLLPVPYVGSYFALLVPTSEYRMTKDRFWFPQYRIGLRVDVFAPIHWLDRRARFERWHAKGFQGDDGFTPTGWEPAE